MTNCFLLSSFMGNYLIYICSVGIIYVFRFHPSVTPHGRNCNCITRLTSHFSTLMHLVPIMSLFVTTIDAGILTEAHINSNPISGRPSDERTALPLIRWPSMHTCHSFELIKCCRYWQLKPIKRRCVVSGNQSGSQSSPAVFGAGLRNVQ